MLSFILFNLFSDPGSVTKRFCYFKSCISTLMKEKTKIQTKNKTPKQQKKTPTKKGD